MVGQCVGSPVVFPGDMFQVVFREKIQQFTGFGVKRSQLGLSRFEPPAYLIDHKQTVRPNYQTSDVLKQGHLQTLYECSVFGLVVGGRSDGAGQGVNLPTMRIVQDSADGRPGPVFLGSPICVQPKRTVVLRQTVRSAFHLYPVFVVPRSEKLPVVGRQAVERPDNNAFHYDIEHVDRFVGYAGKNPGS